MPEGAAGSDISFTWDLGDGHSVIGATVTHTYPDVGVYTATVTATNSINTQSAFTVVTIVPVQHVLLPLGLRQ
ncbi:MAG TPA: PKD domain-containing protein [Anaerolineae bacterium]|nr:PKD domain-containing protein [Anaerolineae bacterium]HQK15714.1 PKD domain-containing protein [Anaerolineae bacterium]